MDRSVFENNQVVISGTVVSEPEYSHEVYGEKFYMVDVQAKRLSGIYDFIPVTVSERMINVKELYIGQRISVYGQFRSFNSRDDGKNRLVLSVFARELEILDDMQSGREENEIVLDGHICKEPVYRNTPLGREITDLMIVVNRSYGKSDYIPCICWGRNARFANNLITGSHIKIFGRIQSREYKKLISENGYDTRTAYEVSVGKIRFFEEE